ncbi:MAG: hypothetical protein GF383_07765 [Candidatus Lokiarchaeota archaeon]|nr:hypothetical protein [Candidatus Lokiarchaeota archaeon]MBD3340167.1 hypothetical protein [Candidatus Lokiarchaeota archaeon]
MPEWLKQKKDEFEDILDELEEHIWDKAEELSDIGTSTESSVRLALAHMGTPESITKEYKRRGTPKIYITEELWPLYTTVLGILSAVVILVNVVFMIISLFTGTFQFDISGFFLWLAGVFIIVTAIFVGLSMEGYLPEDFKTKEERKKEKKSSKSFVDPAGMIVGGIIQMAFGLILVIQPDTDFTHLIDPEFLALLRIFGVLGLSEGCLDLIRGVIGNQQVRKHQIIIGIKIFLSILNIPLLLVLLERPELVPFVGKYIELYLISGFFGFIIFLIVCSIIADTYKAGTLEKYQNLNE